MGKPDKRRRNRRPPFTHRYRYALSPLPSLRSLSRGWSRRAHYLLRYLQCYSDEDCILRRKNIARCLGRKCILGARGTHKRRKRRYSPRKSKRKTIGSVLIFVRIETNDRCSSLCMLLLGLSNTPLCLAPYSKSVDNIYLFQCSPVGARFCSVSL